MANKFLSFPTIIPAKDGAQPFADIIELKKGNVNVFILFHMCVEAQHKRLCELNICVNLPCVNVGEFNVCIYTMCVSLPCV